MEQKTRSEVGGQTTNFQEKRRKNKEIKNDQREDEQYREQKHILERKERE